MAPGPRWPLRTIPVLAAASVVLAACSPVTVPPQRGAWPDRVLLPETAVAAGGSGHPADASAWGVPPPPPFRARPATPRLVVVGVRSLPTSLVHRARAVRGVCAVARLSLASLSVAGRTVTLAAAELSAYRRFVPLRAARTRGVWDRAAAGDLVLEPAVAAELRQPLGGTMALSSGPGGASLRVGALSPMPPSVDGLVNERRGAQIGMPAHNAMLVSTAPAQVRQVSRNVARLVRGRAVVYPLAPAAVPSGTSVEAAAPRGAAAVGAAVLTGGSVARAVGSFRYRYFSDGTVEPDPAWVAANIRTEAVPILGAVTCHQVMLPRLRWALREVVHRGLAGAIDPDDFGGCYVPRFIGHDPALGLSLHTWGIALDLNVGGNQRGTRGDIDRSVVAVFKKWGFSWGGDWAYTDPMHFELAALTTPSGS